MRHINSVVRHVVKAVHDRRSVLVTSAYDVVDLIDDCTSPEVRNPRQAHHVECVRVRVRVRVRARGHLRVRVRV